MEKDLNPIVSQFKGKFFIEPEELRDRLLQVQAYVFDWDGVFNGGIKDESGSSSFSEVDAMGTNLLRFNHYLRHNQSPPVAIISGEKNPAAFSLARREHFDSVYYQAKHKVDALNHFCTRHELRPDQLAFVFDDLLDFSAAAEAGLRILVGRECNPLLVQYAVREGLADYLTAADGSRHAIRETVELLTGISGQYEETLAGRQRYSEEYKKYLGIRNQLATRFFAVQDGRIAEMPAA
jgi:3-deoxy-D-manno-octulosonate 8-phosphate phosphatase (KDO 8-P phosphatase)